MKIIIAFIVIVMSMVVNTAAHAEIVVTKQSYEEVQRYVTKSIPDASGEEISKCYDAVKNGGEYQIKRRKVKITCSEEEMVVFRRLF